MNEPANSLRTRLRNLAASRAAWLALFVVLTVAHFASYFRHGVTFRDEGGTVTLIAQRLLAGERPWVDVSPGGYNLLWFYPVCAIFKLTGVSYVALRVWCFALSALAAVLVFTTVEKAGRKPWLAFLAGAMAVLVPGMTFKNYMPFLAVANGAALVAFALAQAHGRGWWLRVAGGGALLAITWLIRIELGIFFSALWIGALLLDALRPEPGMGKRMLRSAGGVAVLAALFFALHAPVYLDAQRRGFAKEFTGQYTGQFRRLSIEIKRLLAAKTTLTPTATATPAAAAPAKGTGGIVGNEEILGRPGWRQFREAKTFDARWLVPLLYLPLLSLVPLALASLAALLRARRAQDGEAWARATAALLVTGGALTVFPQYFFFRPDSPHLSEFSPAFWMAAATAPLLLRPRGWPARILVALLAVHAALFLVRMVPDRYAGTIWIMKSRNQLFEAENGVRVYVGKKDHASLTAMLAAIRAHSGPEDWLVAYPYHPSINVLANRRTYERDVYIDNDTAPRGWDVRAIATWQEKKPALIVLSDWDVNGIEASRFRNWAPLAREWIAANYDLAGNFKVSSDTFEVFTRRK